MTTFQAKAYMLLAFATFLIALYSSGSIAAHWHIQYERVSSELARERKTADMLIIDNDELRHDKKVCNEVVQRYTADAEKVVRDRMARRRGKK